MNQSKKYSCVEAENAFTSEGGLLPEKPRSRSPFLEGTARSSSGVGFADGTALPKSDEWLLWSHFLCAGEYRHGVDGTVVVSGGYGWPTLFQRAGPVITLGHPMPKHPPMRSQS